MGMDGTEWAVSGRKIARRQRRGSKAIVGAKSNRLHERIEQA